MKLHLFRYECKNCKDFFKSPELFGNPYGEFLLKSKTGYFSYLNAVDDAVFSEFSGLLKCSPKIIDMDNVKRAKILHYVFSIACDNASDGSAFSIMQKPACSKCKEINIGHWGPTNPPEIIDLDVPNVTHIEWNKLNYLEKKSHVSEAVEQVLKHKNDFEIS